MPTLPLLYISTVFAESDEMTFNTKLDSAFRLAEPGTYSGTFELSDPEAGGTLAAGQDGVLTWTPGEDCAAGTYAVTASYSDGCATISTGAICGV